MNNECDIFKVISHPVLFVMYTHFDLHVLHLKHKNNDLSRRVNSQV